MYTTVMTALLFVLGIYLALGIVAAVPIHARILATIDPGVQGAGWFFRVLITPGIVACWPLLFLRWFQGAGYETETDRWGGAVTPLRLRDYHRWLIRLLIIAIPVLCGLGLLARAAAEASAHVR